MRARVWRVWTRELSPAGELLRDLVEAIVVVVAVWLLFGGH